MAEAQSASIAVIDAVANAKGLEPSELRPRLYDVVDPDALNKAVDESNGDVTVSFTYNSYAVTVASEGVTLKPFDD